MTDPKPVDIGEEQTKDFNDFAQKRKGAGARESGLDVQFDPAKLAAAAAAETEPETQPNAASAGGDPTQPKHLSLIHI